MKVRYVTSLFLSTLFWAANRTAEGSSNIHQRTLTDEHNAGVCLSTTPLSLFFKPQADQAITPFVNESFIEKFIVGSALQRKFIVNSFTEMRKIDAQLANSIDLVFSHLAGFRIIVYPTKELEKMTTHYAFYSSSTKTMALSDEMNENNYKMMTGIRHELHHAAMNTVQQLFEKNATRSVECYSPRTDKEKSKIEKMLSIGNKRVGELINLLALEANKTISDTEGKKLAQLRSHNLDIYIKYYPINFDVSFPNSMILEIEKKSGKKFKKGETVNLDDKSQNRYLGNVEIIDIKPLKNRPDGKDIEFKFQDPLQAAVYQISLNREKIKENYPEEYQLFEFGAYLQSIPPGIVKYLFPEFYNYTHSLIKKALEVPMLYQGTQNAQYLTLGEQTTAEILDILKTPREFVASHANSYLVWAQKAISIGEIDAAKMGLNTLIQRSSLHAGKANLMLAQIEYNAGNYFSSADYFKRAEKRKVAFSKTDHSQYAHALSEAGQYKKSSKQNKKM